MSSLSRLMGVVMCLALSTSSLSAQTNAESWRTLVTSLEPAAMVAVRLTDGTRVSGTVISAGEDSFLMNPRTRIPVPPRAIPYDAVSSVERTRVGMSPGLKVLTGIGVGVGGFLLLVAAVVANMD